jgi:HCOMODA/2-hydroxy-3-carboxy-muconic semialdehyde decarboxylase
MNATADPAHEGPAAAPALVQDLVTANHILFHQGVVDAFGHVSVRNDKRPDRFLLARSMAPALVTADDILEFTLDGATTDPRRVYLERFLHAAIYRARPDVGAVVHSHSPAVVPFSVVKSAPLRPVSHMCGFLGGGPPVFEIRDCAGAASDLLIRSNALGDALAASLGSGTVVLMRGHGSAAVGPTLKLAVYRAIYTEVNARLLAESLRLGPVEYLSDGEARETMAVNEGQVDRPWELWKAAAARAR